MNCQNELFVLLLLLFSAIRWSRVNCDEGGNSKNEKDRPKVRHHNEGEFPHKLENAPIPSVHDGPQKVRNDDHSFHRRSKRYSLNPQKPREKREKKNEATHQSTAEAIPRQFHHPGHSPQFSRNLPVPVNTYNYYKVLYSYGDAFGYGQQQFKGYAPTSAIGVVPPRGFNARDYYNRIGDLKDYPLIRQHSLYEDQKYPTHRYGDDYSNRDYARNAYKNVLTGLAMWSIMNGLVNGKRYAVYDHKTIPLDRAKNVTLHNGTVVTCFDDGLALCGSHSEPLCTNNGTTFCVSSCQHDCNNTSTPCALHVTVSTDVLNEQGFNRTLDSVDVKDAVLCVTTLVVPQVVDPNRILCDTTPCTQQTTESTNRLNPQGNK